jgi:hypothetical protein
VEFADKALYHQIHPAKLLTDWATAFVAAYLLWEHALVAGLIVGFIPSVVASALVIRFADLERLKASGIRRLLLQIPGTSMSNGGEAPLGRRPLGRETRWAEP